MPVLEFKKIGEFAKGTLYEQLNDAYADIENCREYWQSTWREYDDFFYSNLDIANKYGFVSVLNGKAIGHISWDPRNCPEFAVIGHNCILSEYKGNGYGKMQLEEAIRRIKESGAKKAIVTTSEVLLPAQKNYESVGFKKICVRENNAAPFSGNEIDYELIF